MKIVDFIRTQEPTFETRLLYAQSLSPYDIYSESKYGYLDGAKECLEMYKSIEELEEYIKQYKEANSPLDEYDKSYLLAISDYIKQYTKESVTNEY